MITIKLLHMVSRAIMARIQGIFVISFINRPLFLSLSSTFALEVDLSSSSQDQKLCKP